MGYFRVKLDAVEWFAIMGYSRIGGRIRPANNVEVGRGSRQVISVRHPYLPERKETCFNRGVINKPAFHPLTTQIEHRRKDFRFRFWLTGASHRHTRDDRIWKLHHRGSMLFPSCHIIILVLENAPSEKVPVDHSKSLEWGPPNRTPRDRHGERPYRTQN